MKRRAAVVLSAAGLLVPGAAVYVWAGGSSATSPTPEPRPGQVHALALRTIADAAAAREKRPVMGVPPERTKPFSMLGVSWDDAGRDLGGTVQVRTRDSATGTWSRWRPVEAGEGDAPGGGARSERSGRGATEPLWVGPSNGVQVRVTGKGAALPKGLRVDLVDPGDGRTRPKPRAAGRAPDDVVLAAAATTTEPSPSPNSAAPTAPASPAQPASPSAESSESPSGSGSPGTTAPPGPAASTTGTAPRPPIVGRAQWGADESLVKAPAEYAPEVKVAFTHHTAGTNDYSCADSPAIIRGIMLYHVKTNEWNDIGYNFLVDKCGTIFEGRAGGADKPVIGAHTYGFNTRSSGVAVLGDHVDYTDLPPAERPDPGNPAVPPSNAALSAVAKIEAWKLGLHGGDPTGKAELTTPIDNGKYPANTTVTFNTISGHRDGVGTECPGRLLYDRLGTIRTQAEQWVTPAAPPVVTSITGVTKAGSTYYTKGTVNLGWKAAAVSRYEVLVDGAVAATRGGMATSAQVTMAAGSRKLQVRAVNLDGTTASSPLYPVVADTTAPVFNTPAGLTVRGGMVGAAGSVPVRLGWKVTDNALLRTVKATSPTARTFTPTTTSWSALAKPNASVPWSLTAADAAGNTRTSAVTRTASLVHESGSTRTGTWKVTTGSANLGGRAYYSGAKGATARYVFTGRSFGLIFKRAPRYGAVHVYVDGVKAATVDTRASSTAYRRILWTKSWKTSARHTVKIVVAGTSGRPTVVTDGIAYIK